MSDFLKTLPDKPGIYQMYSAIGKILYVGKAKNLKKRVSSYYQQKQQSLKTQTLMRHVVRVEVIVTSNEYEALLLENNLIKKFKPRYNILLRDDKSYPYIYLSTDHSYARIDFYRGKIKKEEGRYFGPYPSVPAVRETLNFIQKIFKIRSCTNTFFANRTRPCLQYQIQRCTAPCVGYISETQYAQSVQLAKLFLEGKNSKIVEELTKKMEAASANLEFEQAVRYRDQLISLRRMQAQQVVSTDKGDVDVVAVLKEQGVACVHMLYIRGGRVIGSKPYFPEIPPESEEIEILSAFLTQYYLNPIRISQIPEMIIINYALEDEGWLEKALSQQANKKIHIFHNVRQERQQWLQMTINNAQLALKNHLSNQITLYQRFETLQKELSLEALPQRMECFDVSHTMGDETVASCVVFDQTGPLKQEYRRFNIHGITKGDDYAALFQALLRRYTRLKTEEMPLPDILLIDGGKGQLAQAEKALEELQVKGVFMLGIAKGPGRKAGLETLILSTGRQEVHLSPDSPALHLLQHIRDEAHRFAITGHRQQRAKKSKQSPLEQIEGVGPQRRLALLRYFGGLQEIRNASVKQIMKVKGISSALAQKILDALR